MTVPTRLLVIDESLDRRLAHQLEQRGRQAMSAERLGLIGMSDPDVLRALAGLEEDIRALAGLEEDLVLVTGDDAMPGEHGDLIAKLGITVATVDGRRRPGWRPEKWKKEIVHRWAHSIEIQEPRTIRRYGLRTHALWRRRRGRG